MDPVAHGLDLAEQTAGCAEYPHTDLRRPFQQQRPFTEPNMTRNPVGRPMVDRADAAVVFIRRKQASILIIIALYPSPILGTQGGVVVGQQHILAVHPGSTAHGRSVRWPAGPGTPAPDSGRSASRQPTRRPAWWSGAAGQAAPVPDVMPPAPPHGAGADAQPPQVAAHNIAPSALTFAHHHHLDFRDSCTGRNRPARPSTSSWTSVSLPMGMAKIC